MKLSKLLRAKAASCYKVSHQAATDTWFNHPTQDNEGFRPDRVGFIYGWKLGVDWQSKQTEALLTKVGAALDAAEKANDVTFKDDAYNVIRFQFAELADAIAELRKEWE